MPPIDFQKLHCSLGLRNVCNEVISKLPERKEEDEGVAASSIIGMKSQSGNVREL